MGAYGPEFFKKYIDILDEGALPIPNLGKPPIRSDGARATRPGSMRPTSIVPTNAAPSGLRASYLAMIKTLELTPAPDEGFFGRNIRNNSNNQKLAEWARENGLSGVFNPETGDYIKFGEDPEDGMPNDEVDASTPTAGVDFDELDKLAKIGAIPPKAIDDLTKEAGYYDSGERSFSRRDIIGNITGEPNPEYRDKILGILKTNQGVVAPAKPASPGEAPPPTSSAAKTPPKPPQGTGTGQVTGTGPEPEVTVEPLPEPEKKAEPAPGDPNYPYKPGDYTGPDGIEDMETGKIVKPDGPPKGNLSHLKTFAGSGKGGLRNDPDEVDAIKQLQKKLGIEADGKYGSNTKDAVKKFQEKHGLTVDGDAGPETIGKMIELQKPKTPAAAPAKSEPPKPIPDVKKDQPKAIPKISGQSSTSEPFQLMTAEGMRGLQDKIMNIAKD